MALRRVFLGLALVAFFGVSYANAAEWGLKKGTPELKSAGPLAFGPDGILLVGDTKGATVFAIDTGDTKGDSATAQYNISGVNTKIARLLGGAAKITINDLAVNPMSGNVYLSVSQGAGAKPALVRINPAGKLSQVALKGIAFSKAKLPNPPADRETGQGRRRRNNRESSITDLAFIDGKVLISGLSAEASPSNVREIEFPFSAAADQGTSLEIYHGAHGRLEDAAPIYAFVPFNIGGEPNLLAGFQCTPLVRFPVESLKPGEKVRGTTIAELGNGNRPLDMIVYKKNGKDFLLMANSRRGVMKISTDNIENQSAINEKISGTAGQSYETIENLKGVMQLDRLNDLAAVILVQNDSGEQILRSITLP